jgi:hypothetical protein
MSSTNGAPALPPPIVLNTMMAGYWISRAIYAAAALGVADRLAAGPSRVGDLAKAIGAHEESLYRLLRALASVGVFTETEPRKFALTPMAGCLQTGPGSLRSLSMFDHLQYVAFEDIVHSVKTGKTAFEHRHGQGLFEYLEKHPEDARTFDEGMSGFVNNNAAAVVASYDFSGFGTIVDVGGGLGLLLGMILKANLKARGVLLDLPHVADRAKKSIADAGLSPRCEVVGGDFFKSVPSNGDAYLMASILHDWDDDRSVAILKACRQAAPKTAKVLLVEMVIPPGDSPFFGKLLDLNMLVVLGGRERTEAEYRDLLSAGGFQLTRIVATPALASVVEAVPA